MIKRLMAFLVALEIPVPTFGSTNYATRYQNRTVRRFAWFNLPGRMRDAWYTWQLDRRGIAAVAGGAKTRVAAISPLFYSKVFGGLPSIVDVSMFPGNIFYVDSGDGADTAGNGTHPDSPFETIDFAVGQCTAAQGDVIFVLPGHAETISAAGGLDLDVAGITIIGIGEGADQPTVTLDTVNTADIDIDAANITIVNVNFVANFADIVAAIDVNADDFTLRKCRFTESATAVNALIWVQDGTGTTSDRITIEDCRANCPDAANTHFINFAGTGDGHRVNRNTLMGDWGTMCIGGAGVITYAEIKDNTIMNKASDNDACVNVAATATGVCVRNLAGGAAAQANGITTGDMVAAENYYCVHTEDLQAILDPIVT